ncbi:hypothetical protein B0I35DRAFT_471069, partial [Stachybotrys elegans]
MYGLSARPTCHQSQENPLCLEQFGATLLSMSFKKLQRTDYHVAWVAPVSDLEVLPSRLMLDEEHDAPDYDTAYDDNIYICGAMAGHNVTFSSIRMAVLVGIGGGIPRAQESSDPTSNVHLGDVVVGWPGDGKPACMYYDSGRQHADAFEMLGTINRPDRVLLNALGKLASDHDMDRSTFEEHRERLLLSKHRRKFLHPGLEHDRLFYAGYQHGGQYSDGCVQCDEAQLVRRSPRTEEDAASFIFHRGRIATGNAVIQDGVRRDQIRDQCDGALCVEMEVAGVDASRPCLVVRGISDYADSHKSDKWRLYAAGNAAIFARELLSKIPPSTVAFMGGKTVHFIPFRKNTNFTGRADIIERIEQLLSPSPEGSRVALVGLGGMGKTQIALHIAYLIKENPHTYQIQSVVWMPAWSMAGFEQACAALVQELKLGLGDDKDPRTAVKSFLTSPASGSWLLIVDNADDMRTMYGHDGQVNVIFPFLPPIGKNRHILFTTRSQEMAVNTAGRCVIELTQMSSEEAEGLFHSLFSSPSKAADSQSVKELLEVLTHLPLAIIQASAYININRLSPKEYLHLIKNTDQDMVEVLGEGLWYNDAHYQRAQGAVATTWIITFSQIQETDDDAARLLFFIACVEPKAIPQSLLPALGSKQRMVSAIGTLCGYRFLDQRDDTGVYDMHSLVHLAIGCWMSQQMHVRERQAAVMHMETIFPTNNWEHRFTWQRYLPHAIRLLQALGESVDPVVCHLGHRVGSCLQLEGQITEAVRLLTHVVAARGKTVAEDHPDRLASQRELAGAYRANGQTKEAVGLLEYIVAVGERKLAENHPDQLASQHALAGAYQANGQIKEAVELFKHVVATRERTLAEEHPDRLASRYALAVAYRANGQIKEAVELHKHVVAVREEILAEDHPSRLASQHGLAVAYKANGQIEEAVRLLEHVVAVEEKSLGGEHPNLLVSQHELAGAYEANGQIKEAVRLLEHVVATRDRILAEDHPDRLLSQYALAGAYYVDGQVKEAVELFKHVVATRERTLA